MIMGESFETNGAKNEIVEPSFTMTKTFDVDRLTLEVLQDLGLTKVGPNMELVEINSKDANASLNEPIDRATAMESNQVLGQESSKKAMVPYARTVEVNHQQDSMDPNILPNFTTIAKTGPAHENNAMCDIEHDTEDEVADGTNSVEFSDREKEQEAEASWAMGKEIGLLTKIDYATIQAIMEELVAHKWDRRKKNKKKGKRKAKKNGGDTKSGEVSTPL